MTVTRREILAGGLALGAGMLGERLTSGTDGSAAAAEATGAVEATGVAGYRARLVPAPPLQLYEVLDEWADCNSPVLREAQKTLAFVSSFQPIGHPHRRIGGRSLRSLGSMEPVRILDDSTPDRGKWIESVLRAGNGRLYGWYHAETRIEAREPLFVPAIGAMVSDDDGASWRLIGEPFELSHSPPDPTFANGFVAGGVGDFCALADATAGYVYIHASNYGPAEAAAGLIALRYPLSALDIPHAALEVWAGKAGWRPVAHSQAEPFFPPDRGWRHADPAAFWGPAVHANRGLGAYVMLLNRTVGGNRDWRQEGIYVSFNRGLDDPTAWTMPEKIVDGGLWYPQVVGLGLDAGDTRAGPRARFFLSGFSAWHIVFSAGATDPTWPEPASVDRATVIDLVAGETAEPRPALGRGRGQGRRERPSGRSRSFGAGR